MRIGSTNKGKQIEISLLDRVSWLPKFGEEEVNSFISYAYRTMTNEYVTEDLPKIIDYKLSGDFCIDLKIVTEYGCFYFIAAPYAIYGDVFPKPDNPYELYHYTHYYMPHELIKTFNKWIVKIEGPISLDEKRKKI